MLLYIDYIVCTLLFISLLILINIKHKLEPEKYYLLNMILYFLGSAVYVGDVPFGFLFCILIMLSHPNVRNKKVKVIAIFLGFLSAVIAIAINKLKL